MARNEEKSRSVLNRWYLYQRGDLLKPQEKRPKLTSTVDNVYECEKWRHEILKEISFKVEQIQNESLDEYRIRELNDEINKLMREKSHWEKRIRELGGPDYKRTAPKVLDDSVIVSPTGYCYFGAARNLPGVRELLVAQTPKESKKTKAELEKLIDSDYYGYRDEDDGLLEKLEREAELEALKEFMEEWEQIQNQKVKLEAA